LTVPPGSITCARFYTELLGCGLGLLAGVVQSWWQPEGFGERLAAPVALSALVIAPFIKPLLDPLDLDQLQDRCPGEVCLQSTFSTCGPASAATLLRTFGDHATEKRHCAGELYLSRRHGNLVFVSVFKGTRCSDDGDDSTASRRLIAESGDRRSLASGHTGHFIAVLDSNQVETIIADPLKGKIVLNRGELNQRYQFTGFFLVLGKPDS
jgi:hypothetical protein